MAISDRPFGPVTRGPLVQASGLNKQATADGRQSSVLPNMTVITAAVEAQLIRGNGIPLSVAIPQNEGLESTVFDLFISGTMTSSINDNVAINLYGGASSVIANNTLLASTSQSAAVAPLSWWVRCKLIYDVSATKLLFGAYDYFFGSVGIGAGGFYGGGLVPFNTAVPVSPNSSQPIAQFSLTVTSSSATLTAPTTVTVQKFSLG